MVLSYMFTRALILRQGGSLISGASSLLLSSAISLRSSGSSLNMCSSITLFTRTSRRSSSSAGQSEGSRCPSGSSKFRMMMLAG